MHMRLNLLAVFVYTLNIYFPMQDSEIIIFGRNDYDEQFYSWMIKELILTCLLKV